MSTYNDLPVYKETYDLLLEMFQFTKDFSKEYKYTIGESLKKETIEVKTVSNLEIVQNEGGREVKRNVEFYNLYREMLLSFPRTTVRADLRVCVSDGLYVI